MRKATYRADNCTVVHLCSKNDTNGNPRRLYGVYCGGATLAVLEEGYEGSSVLDQPWGKEVGEVLRRNVAMDVEITPKEYRRLRAHKTLGTVVT